MITFGETESEFSEETVEEFLARGGKSTKCKAYNPTQKVVLRVKHRDKRVARDFIYPTNKSKKAKKQNESEKIKEIDLSLIPDDLLDLLAGETNGESR